MGLYCKMGVLAWNCIAMQFTVLQEKAGKAGLYCNTLRCIATVGQRQGWTILRYSAQPSHDTARRRAGGALGAGAGRAGRWAGRRWARRRGARGESGWARRARAGSGTAWALGVQAGARAGVGAAGARVDS